MGMRQGSDNVREGRGAEGGRGCVRRRLIMNLEVTTVCTLIHNELLHYTRTKAYARGVEILNQSEERAERVVWLWMTSDIL